MIHIINWYKPRWRLLIVLLTPLVLLPIPLVRKSSQARCGYIVLILTIYWVFEAIPLALFSMCLMWISNSAATSIMLPVALAITNELESHTKGYHEKKNGAKEATAVVNGFLLAVVYSATIGGLSRLLGTAPNIFVKGFTDKLL
ncbi:unnamed protein product [Adineta steineri]|uniref:Citrate transporter-like domain-containing protein n=1 Tax=Adineta steineri TaxID=433720 RepID=A0A816BT40_9BILA|nr:unnamed protein product [Adineta steineri]CAF1613039.1 unnamed protein product [Adineta steineri]